MNKNAKLYTLSIIVIGMTMLMANISEVFINIEVRETLLFIFLIIVSEIIAIEANEFSNISLGFSIAFTVIILFSSTQAATMMFFGFLFVIYKVGGKYRHIFNSSFYKRLFNASSYYITVYSSSMFFNYTNSLNQIRIGGFGIFALAGTVIAYLLLNSAIFIMLFAIITKMSLKDMVLKNIWALKSFFTLSPFGVMMLLFYVNYGAFGLIIFFGPLFLARYTFKMYLNMKEVYLETITALTNAIDAKDKYTHGHSKRVAEYSMMIGKQIGLDGQRLDNLKKAALLHDVGKIGISDNILLKPGKLDKFEMDIIKSHPVIGAQIIDEIEFLDKAKVFISQHHERYDGDGYPNGEHGDELMLESCILSVADAFDAMTSDRSYRKALTEEKSFEILKKESGKQFSPEVVKAMVSLKERIGRVIIDVD